MKRPEDRALKLITDWLDAHPELNHPKDGVTWWALALKDLRDRIVLELER